jgi:hypothetical protein
MEGWATLRDKFLDANRTVILTGALKPASDCHHPIRLDSSKRQLDAAKHLAVDDVYGHE